MNEDVIELERLYSDGVKTAELLENAFEKYVPTRDFVKNFRLSNDLFSVLEEVPQAPENSQLGELLTSAKAICEKWVNSVNDILDRVGKIRYKLQFNNPQVIGLTIMKFELTRNEEKLSEIINDFISRVGELRRIVIALEESTEQVTRKSDEPVEPATYDKKTRTIFFADKAIRFKKDAPFTPALCDIVFSKPTKLWTLKELQKVWDGLYEFLGNERPTDWHRVYEAISRLNERIRKETGIDDLFIFSTQSVRLNSAYLEVTKKSQ
jgi:hypothetical protein